MNKREFLKWAGGASLGMLWGDFLFDDAWHARLSTTPPAALARDDAFWAALRRTYRLTPDYINLENGYYSMQSEPVLESFIAQVRQVNVAASYYMRTRQFDDKFDARRRVAALAGCSVEELIITRNATESLDTVVAGFDWKAGDGAVMAEQDYGAMLDMFRMQSRRYGIVNAVVSLPLHPASDDEIVSLYERAITPGTRLLMVCHQVNITGQVLPVQKIAAMARRHNVQVMVDGAHAFAQLDFRIPELGCDYYGASLHKWLGCPLGTGLLYVRRDRIATLWPMFADEALSADDIRKLNHTGTHPVHTDLAIRYAVEAHEAIGIVRKEARLRFLQQYWTSKVRDLPRIRLNTPADPARNGAIANVGVEGMTPGELASTLLSTYRIWTVAIDSANVRGVRVTPQLFTTTAELDTLVRALQDLARV